AAAANLSLSYELLGLIAKRRRQWPDAIRYFQKALSLREKSGSAELVANAWENLGDVYMATQKPEKALRAYRLGARSTQKTDILRAGRLRAEALLQLAASRPNGGYLDEALLLYASLDSVATELRLFYRDEGSKQQLVADCLPFYEKAIQTALALYRHRGEQRYLETAYFFSTRNKALLLQDGLQELQAKDLGLPDSVTLRESQLRRACYRLFAAADPAYPEARLAYQHFIQQLERAYPEYYRIKFASAQRVDLAQVQQKIAADAAILEFFTGSTAVHIFLITPYAGLQVFSAALPEGFQDRIGRLRALAEDLNAEALSANYAQLANPLFQTLLQQPLVALRSETTRLCLVADAPLLKTPFDLLPTQTVDRWEGAEGPMLIRRFALSSTFSTQYLLSAPQHRRQKENLQRFGGFGLEYDDFTLKALQAANQDLDTSLLKRNFGRLAYSDDEVREIAGLLHGTAWLNTEARKSVFLQQVDRFRILHLAMHGFLKESDPQRSALIFSKSPGEEDFYLHLAEIYGLPCNADMVVLSACNSSNGPSVPGEGLQSLALAFAYAGCPSVVANQWSASDQSSKDILLRFYRYLDAGLAKDVALQKAKLDYLQQSMPTYSTPAYWSSLILIGDPAAILLPGEKTAAPAVPANRPYGWLAALSALLITGFFWWWKRKK
ncbi:MAG: CHAT domain-containing protein, partial [Saprospiraceae bacterium]|nr:CHAT domain-containing protein [Saprospiraceae bacterium]